MREQRRGVAAFIAETCPSVGGQLMLPPGYLADVYAHVRAAGGVCIADEVQTGLGRMGTHFWAFEAQDVVPDIVVMGKPLGNGHPLAAVVTTRAIADAFDNGMEFFSTFGGNTVSCAVGLAVLDVRARRGAAGACARGGRAMLGARLRALVDAPPIVGDVRGSGLFLGRGARARPRDAGAGGRGGVVRREPDARARHPARHRRAVSQRGEDPPADAVHCSRRSFAAKRARNRPAPAPVGILAGVKTQICTYALACRSTNALPCSAADHTFTLPIAREHSAPVQHLPPRSAGDSVIVSTEWLAAHLHDPNVVVLQVNMAMMNDAPFTAGHIPGARELPYDVIAIDKDGLDSEMPSVDSLRDSFERAGVSDRSHVVVYYSSQAPSAARAVMALDYLGHDRVSFLDGGLPKWRAEGRPIETTATPVARGTMHAKPKESVIATAPWIESRIGKPGIALIDTRTDGEYLGSGMRHGMPSEGHRRRAAVAVAATLSGGQRVRARRAAQEPGRAREAVRGSHASGDTVVTYCWVGYRASTTYLAARAVGLPVKLYDGS